MQTPLQAFFGEEHLQVPSERLKPLVQVKPQGLLYLMVKSGPIVRKCAGYLLRGAGSLRIVRIGTGRSVSVNLQSSYVRNQVKARLSIALPSL